MTQETQTPATADKLRDWLLYTGRFIESFEEFVQALGVSVRAFGYPVDRLNLGVYILHPEIAGVAFQWRYETGKVLMVPVEHGDLDEPIYTESPIRSVVESRIPLRVDVRDAEAGADFPVIDEFRRDGVTGYLAMPLAGGGGRMNVWSVTTKDDAGFTDAHWQDLQGFSIYLSLVVDYLAVQWLSGVLMQVYLGRRTGARVLRGQVKRGDGQRIQAALWFCDMRGFTELSSRLSPDGLIEVLNRYFGSLGPALTQHQGEILKFIGDAMLAIFPINEEESDMRGACTRALTASKAALAELERWSELRTQAGDTPIQCGIALHVGEVVYGNIGTPGRLDFTVIGEAVNRVARVESLCGPLGEVLLATDEFVQSVDCGRTSVGNHVLKGIDEAVEVFRLEVKPTV